MVEKSIKKLSAISDRAVILEKGRDVWTGEISALTSDVTER